MFGNVLIIPQKNSAQVRISFNRVERCIIRGADPCTCKRSFETAKPKSQHSQNVTKQMYTINLLFFDFLIWAALGQSGHPRCLGTK